MILAFLNFTLNLEVKTNYSDLEENSRLLGKYYHF